MNKIFHVEFRDLGWGRKTTKIVKLWLIFLIVTFNLSLKAKDSMAVTFTLKLMDVSVESVFKKIEENSNYRFVYQIDDVESLKKINIDVKDVDIHEILSICDKEDHLEYLIENDYIIIRSKEDEKSEAKAPIKVKGKVTDSEGAPLVGATVLEVGTLNGVTTDSEGNFVLDVVGDNAVLKVSFIGYTAQQITVGGKTQINVTLIESVSEVDEVVVTGYYYANKKTYTGSATRISEAEISKISSGNLLETLQVIEPSFNIVENIDQGSNPNMMPDFELRGTGSLPGLQSEFQNNPNLPTFILDGFEVSAQKIFDLDPNRVSSITILKDASATAIYGSRAANGVVVVETKIPKKGRLNVNYKQDIKFSSADLSDYDLLNASEKLEYEVLAGVYPGATRVSVIEDNMDEYYQKRRLVAMGYDTDWLAQPINPLSVSHKHSLQIEEGTDKFRYNLNLFYDKDNGVMKESSRDRLGIGAFFQYRYKNFLFMNNLTYNSVVANNSPYGSFSEYAEANPYLPYEDINGNVVKLFDFVNTPNPMYNANIGSIDKDAYDEITNNFKLEWNITENLKLKNSITFSKKIINDKLFLPADHTIFNDYYTSLTGTIKDKAGTYRNENGEELFFNVNSVVSYIKKIKDHFLTFNGGFEVITHNGQLNIFQTRGFPNSLLAYPSFGTSYDMTSSGSGSVKPDGSEYISRSSGFFGTFNYSWKDRYFADFSGRIDGSSKFGAKNRWAKLWSVGIGWNVHYEEFLKDSEVINKLRFRASRGFTGSQNYNPNQSLTMFDYIRNYYYHRYYAGAELTAIGNDNLKWQRTQKNNIGIDLELFKRRITATFDYYLDDSKDALTQVTIPPSLGFTSYTENLGEVRNEGYEVKIIARIVSDSKREFNWSVFGSAAHNKNTLLKISNALDAWNTEQDAIDSSNPKVRFVEGQDMKSIWVVPSLGIDPATGSEIFLSKDGEYTTEWDANDQIVGGTLTPDLYGNIGTLLTYKQFQMNLYFLYSMGAKTYNQTLVDRVENADPLYNVDRRAMEGRWKNPGDISRFKNINDLSTTKPTSRFIEDNNYLRFKSFNLSYEFKKRQIEKLRLQRLKIILYANDVFNISSVKQERGLSYPYARSYSLTVQVGI